MNNPDKKLPIPPRPFTRYGLSLPALAALVGIHQATLRHRLAMGAPSPPADASKRLLNAWVRRFEKWSARHRQETAAKYRPTNQHDVDPAAARYQAAWQRTRSERAQLELDQRRGQLVKRADVINLAGLAVLTVRARLNAMVTKMTARLANVPDHVVAEELQDEVDAICTAFAEGMSKCFGGIDPISLPCPFCKQERGLGDT